MDLLENYKKAWNNQPEETNTISKIDIYKMAHSRSSSIVKWIFIIGFLEFALLLSFLFIDVDLNHLKKLNLYWHYIIINTASYCLLFYFIIKFYQNYKSISTTDNTKTLMSKILKTRKSVRNYVFLNLSLGALFVFIATISTVYNDYNNMSTSQIAIFIIAMLVIGALIIFIAWCIYQLLYGILLRKLNRNYKELAKLEELN